MIRLIEHADGTVLAIRAQPGARRSQFMGEINGALKVAVTAPPQDGRANKAILELLARTLGLRKSQVVLVFGETSRDKKVLLRDISVAAVRDALRRATDPG